MPLLYKTLFEVKLMHEYFVTDINGQTMFNEPLQQNRLQFLLDGFAHDVDSIEKELNISLSDAFTSLHDSHCLKLIPAYSGFKVMIRVNEKKLSDLSTVFEPFVLLPDNLAVYIQLSRKNSLIDLYTNARINRPFASTWFFSNENITGAKIFPYLSNAAAPVRFDYTYEQGELAASGTDLVAFYKDMNGADAWKAVSGQFLANEGDRLLAPLQFKYLIDAKANVTQATFVLKDGAGNEVKSIAAGGSSALTAVGLDFSDKALALGPEGNASLGDHIYTLQVSGNNGYHFEKNIVFSNALYNESSWATIMIQLTAKNPLFNLLDGDGRLITRRDANDIITGHPVFEIRVPSRAGYWRYMNNRGSKLDLIPDLTGYLFESNGVLQTISPRSIAKSYFLLANDAGTETKFLPNPVNYALARDDQGRICFDIKVPESDLFPVLP